MANVKYFDQLIIVFEMDECEWKGMKVDKMDESGCKWMQVADADALTPSQVKWCRMGSGTCHKFHLGSLPPFQCKWKQLVQLKQLMQLQGRQTITD